MTKLGTDLYAPACACSHADRCNVQAGLVSNKGKVDQDLLAGYGPVIFVNRLVRLPVGRQGPACWVVWGRAGKPPGYPIGRPTAS